MRRLIRRLAKVVIVVFVIYAIVGNIFLNTPLGPWAINRKPERFQLTWSHGVTWFPGFVVLWNVHANGHVRHVVWDAEANRAYGRIAVSPLFVRELRMLSIEIGEVTGSVDRSAEEMLPPPALAGGWTLRFDRIATRSLRRVRVLGLDIQTTGAGEIGFIKQLRGGPMEVLPSHIVLADSTFTLGDHVLMRDARIESEFAIARHLRDDAPGLAKLGLTDATVQIAGALPALALDLDANGHWHGAVVSDATGGRVDANLVVNQGHVKPGGSIDLRVPLRATRGGRSTDAMATLRIDAQDQGFHVVAQLPPPPEGRGSIDADLVIADTALPVGDPKALLTRVTGRLDLEWHFDSLGWLTPLLVKKPWLALDGAGTVKAALRIDRGKFEAGSRVDVPEVELAATVAGHRFQGSAVAHARLVEANGGPRAEVNLVLARFDAVEDGERTKPLLRGNDLHIDLQSAGDEQDFRESLRAQMKFTNAEVPDLRAINPYLPGDALSLRAGRVHIDGDLALDASGSVLRGRVGLHGRDTQSQFGAINLSGDFDLDARVGGSDIATRRFNLDNTTLALRNVKVTDEGYTAGEKWWANIGLRMARVEATRPFQVDADANLQLQNIGLMLALFSKHRDFPKWALRLADAGTVNASGRMKIDGKTIVFDRVEASNDRFDVKARMRIANKQPSGDMLLNWGILTMGVEVDKGKLDTRFIGGKKWYESRPPLLESR